DPDPALAGPRRARRRRRPAALRQPPRRLQRHRPRPPDRRRRLRHLAGPRPPLRPGPLRPAVRRRQAPGAAAVNRRRTFVVPHARRRGDRAGDPLEGLVNLFDLGIVLAVAFLLAALASLKLSSLLTEEGVTVVRESGGRQ